MSDLHWGGDAIGLTFLVDPDGPVCLTTLERAPGDIGRMSPSQRPYDPHRDQPLVEVSAHGHGRFPGGFRHVDTVIGRRLRFESYVAGTTGPDGPRHPIHTLRIRQRDPETGMRVESVFEVRDGVAAFRTWTEVTVDDGELVIDFVSTFASAAVFGAVGREVDDLSLVSAASDWVAESRWSTRPLREAGLARIDRELQHHPARSRCVVGNRGAWSTGEALPTGALVATDPAPGSVSVAWQVEHNGPWLYELGETRASAYLLLSGPTDQEHQWSTTVRPGAGFVSVPASVSLGGDRAPGGLDSALGALTDQRRAIRLPREADRALPVVFNDYMNTLMGDPTTDRLLPLIDAAAETGADCFCIDAGWYAEGHWWDTVGEWRPAASRFPNGIEEVLDRIRDRGMVPGLWLEPEVVGVRSPLARSLPDSAFFSRGGVRVAEHGRHLLDLRDPAARAHLDEVVDRLVGDLGVGFFKMDYNTMPGPGTDREAISAGDGLLGHARALLDWIDDLQRRHPALLIESCASGAMRMDYATLSRLHLQSTSDQQDAALYAPIAAAAGASILPEQAGHWAYPNVDMNDELFAFALVNGILGRLYLSGYLNRMPAGRRAIVSEAIRVHRTVLGTVTESHPRWPVGLPGWEDPWVCAGLTDADGMHLSVWRRSAAAGDTLRIPLPEYTNRDVLPAVAFPAAFDGWDLDWDRSSGVLTVRVDVEGPSARVLRLDPR